MKKLARLSTLTAAVVAVTPLVACGAVEPLNNVRDAVAGALALNDGSLEDTDAPAAVDGDLEAFLAACSEEALAALNEDEGDFIVPPLPTLPDVAEVAPACDEAARTESVVATCGPLTPATGSTLAEQAASCAAGTTCHIVLGEGDFDGNLDLGCAIVEGAGAATRIHGALSFSQPSVLARVAVDDAYGAVDTTADLLVTEAELVGGYEGLGFAWDATLDVAVCRSRVAGGYSGVAQSWGSEKLTVSGSAISACYEAVSSSWGSSGLHVDHNVLFAGYVGVHIHNSLASAVIANTIYGESSAVDVFSFEDDPEFEYDPTSAGAVISGNTILGGTMPESDPANDIVVEDNE